MPGQPERRVIMNTSILESNNPLMALITGRNQLADAVFYDVSSLTAPEWLSLKPWIDRKGGISAVSPGDPDGIIAVSPGDPTGSNKGLELRLMSWGDGSAVPTSDKNLLVVGNDSKDRLRIRIFDAAGNRITDRVLDQTDKTLPKAQAEAIATLKKQLPDLLSRVPTDTEKAQVIRDARSIVYQSRSKETIRHYKHALEFVIKERDRVEAIAVAGVGSSVVGTAALARSVANTYGIDVAGIVSGYGLSDVVLEGLGGWYFYGKIDQLRYEMERGIADLNAILSKTFAKGSDVAAYLKNFEFPLDDYVPPSLDVSALNEILLMRWCNAARPKMKIRLLVGHSKGNLLISSALNHIANELKKSLDEMEWQNKDLAMHNLAVVTLGAVVNLPEKLINQPKQFLGALDLLGRAKSRALTGTIEPGYTRINGGGHHLNTRIPGYLDLKEVRDKYLPQLPDIDSDIQPHERDRDRLYRERT